MAKRKKQRQKKVVKTPNKNSDKQITIDLKEELEQARYNLWYSRGQSRAYDEVERGIIDLIELAQCVGCKYFEQFLKITYKVKRDAINEEIELLREIDLLVKSIIYNDHEPNEDDFNE